MTVWYGVCADERERNSLVWKTDKGEVKVPIEEKGFKDFK